VLSATPRKREGLRQPRPPGACPRQEEPARAQYYRREMCRPRLRAAAPAQTLRGQRSSTVPSAARDGPRCREKKTMIGQTVRGLVIYSIIFQSSLEQSASEAF